MDKCAEELRKELESCRKQAAVEISKLICVPCRDGKPTRVPGPTDRIMHIFSDFSSDCNAYAIRREFKLTDEDFTEAKNA